MRQCTNPRVTDGGERTFCLKANELPTTGVLTPSLELLTHITPRRIWAWPVDLFAMFFPINAILPVLIGYIKSLLQPEYRKKSISFAEIRAFCSFFGGAKSVHLPWN